MLVDILLAIHIAVLGYWLGAEFVINSEYRYVCRSPAMPWAERQRLMEHVMDVDQHVRYALVLQAGLGTALSALLGYLPGGTTLAWLALAVMAVWLALVEITHRLRHGPRGAALARTDRMIRYILLPVVVAMGLVHLFDAGLPALPDWLAFKLILFAGVIAGGIGIRLALIRFFRVWQEIATQGSTEAREQSVRAIYVGATSILVAMWGFIAAVAIVSVLKPF